MIIKIFCEIFNKDWLDNGVISFGKFKLNFFKFFRKMKNLNKIFYITCLLFILVIIALLFISLNEKSYSEKYEETKINQEVLTILQDWGEPDSFETDFQRDSLILITYKRGILGWDTYIFLVDKKSLKLRYKYIDD